MNQQAVNLNALDCTAAHAVSSVKYTELCRLKDDHLAGNELKAAAILQHVEYHQKTGYKCETIESVSTMVCGFLSHEKMYESPDVMIPVATPLSTCNTAIKAGLFKLSDGTDKIVTLNSITYYKQVLVGDLYQEPNNVRCRGGITNIDNKTVSDLIRYVSGQFRLVETTFQISESEVIETATGVKIPQWCLNYRDRPRIECQTTSATFIIPDARSMCEYQIIRQLPFNATKIKSLTGRKDALINHEHKLFIELAGTEKLGKTCGNLLVQKTNHERVKIALLDELNSPPKFEEVDPDNIQVSLMIGLVSEYDRYLSESLWYRYARKLGNKMCSLSATALDNTVRSPFHDDRMIVTRGDLIQEISCKQIQVTAKIGETRIEGCLLNLLPVWRGTTPMYMQAKSHLLVETITNIDRIACDHRYSAIFTTVDDQLITADPEVKILDLNLMYNEESLELLHVADGEEPVHDDRADDLLYTEREMTAYSELIHFRRAKEQISYQLVGKYCHKSRECGAYNPDSANFDLQQLEARLSPLSWLNSWIEKLQQIGSFCAIGIALFMIWSILYKFWQFCHLTCKRKLQVKKAAKLVMFTDTLLLKAMIPANEEAPQVREEPPKREDDSE